MFDFTIWPTSTRWPESGDPSGGVIHTAATMQDAAMAHADRYMGDRRRMDVLIRGEASGNIVQVAIHRAPVPDGDPDWTSEAPRWRVEVLRQLTIAELKARGSR